MTETMKTGSVQGSKARSNEGLLRLQNMLALVVIMLVVVIVLIPLMPAQGFIPQNDSGNYLYIGKKILQGAKLYSDVWDNKPPLIFFVNAIGLFLGKGSIWGVWALQLVFQAVAGWLAFRVLKSVLGIWPACVGVCAGFLAEIYTLGLGNFTEEYAVTFQAISVFSFLMAWQQDRPLGLPVARNYLGYGLLSGLAAAGAFLLKPNLIGIWAAIFLVWGVYILVSKYYQRLWYLVWSLAGGFLGLGIISLIFALNHQFSEFWSAAIAFNLIYSGPGDANRMSLAHRYASWLITKPAFALTLCAWLLPALLGILQTKFAGKTLSRKWFGILVILMGGLTAAYLSMSWTLGGINWQELSFKRYAYFGLIALGILFGVGVLNHWVERVFYPRLKMAWHSLTKPSTSPALLLALAALPVELGMILISPREYTHYLISLWVAVVLWTGLFSYILLSALSGQKIIQWAVLIALLAVIAVPAMLLNRDKLRLSPDPTRQAAIEFIDQNTQSGDTVLILGAEGGVFFLSNRDSATRYVPFYPFYTRGYTSAALWADLLQDMKNSPPRLVIDPRNGNTPFIAQSINGPVSQIYDTHPAGMDSLIDYVQRNYTLVDSGLGPAKWLVFEYQGGN